MHNTSSPTIGFIPPILADIRAATKHLHDRIEAAPALTRLMSRDLGHDTYVAALQAKFRFQAAMQAVLPARLARLRIAWAVPAHALAALAADLSALGAPVPRVPRAPGLGSGLGPVGALYVIEGSLLGGRVIGRHIGDRLGVAPDTGGAFFLGTTADGARDRWRQFCALLASLPEAASPSVCKGAVLGFQFFIACLDGPAAETRGGSAPSLPPPATGTEAAEAFRQF